MLPSPGAVRLGVLLVVLGLGALVYSLMPSCALWVADEDDTLCHAVAAAKDGHVVWPVDEDWPAGQQHCHVFDNVLMNPWWFSEDARAYLEGFGIAQGHHWAHMGRADVRSCDEETYEVNTPLGRTYSAYANMVYANVEGIALDRSRSLSDFDYYDTYLKWAAAYVFQRTYRVNGNCSRECNDSGMCVIARTVSGSFDHIDLFQTFYYDIDSVYRASTIVHEVRHARQHTPHTGGSGCPRNHSCDRKWSDNGSNTFELLWLAAYYWGPADNPFLTPARRERARALFLDRRRDAFVDRPQWTLDDLKTINEDPEFFATRAPCSESPEKPVYCFGLGN